MKTTLFEQGSTGVRADFHLHTRADNEFFYTGDENSYFTSYVNALVVAGIHVGVVTNHNKFNVQEFKILKKRQGRRIFFCFPA